MVADKESFITSRYLVADPSPDKKRNRKNRPKLPSGLLLTDDTDLDASVGDAFQLRKNDSDGQSPPVSSAATLQFRKASESSWRKIIDMKGAPFADDSATADEIIATAAEECDNTSIFDDVAMTVVDDDLTKMSDGSYAGLQSAAASRAQLERHSQRAIRCPQGLDDPAIKAKTAYRDATGRRVDISMHRAKARQQFAQLEEKERQVVASLKGNLQSARAIKYQQELANAQSIPVARNINDIVMNQDLRAKRRWDDPMAQFLSSRERKGLAQPRSISGRPSYEGAALSNRYGILPGYRWDGVDRSIGFEGTRFQAVNQRERFT
jgi:pre-mRNA-splicing factor CWC26